MNFENRKKHLIGFRTFILEYIIVIGFLGIIGCFEGNKNEETSQNTKQITESKLSIDYSDIHNPKLLSDTNEQVSSSENKAVRDEMERWESIRERELNPEKESTFVEKNTRKKTPKYTIVGNLQIRYDGGRSYFVLINTVNLQNDNFIEDIKLIIDDIIQKKGKGINIEILDERNAFDILYRSHHGKNTLGRRLYNNEIKILARHSIASYSSELATSVNPNSLLIFPDADESTPQVGKYVQEIVYVAR